MVTQAEVARDWQTSRVYVHKCVRKGCSLKSLQSARDWRDTYARRRQPTDPKQLRLLDADETSAKDNGNTTGSPHTTMLLQKCFSRPLPSPNSLEFLLESGRRAEVATSILFQQALKERQESKIVASLRNYNAAVDGRLKIERSYHKELEHRQHLIPREIVRQLVCKILSVLVSNLLALPEKVGSLCDPESPSHAIAILRDECMSIITDIKKSWPAEFLDDLVWPDSPNSGIERSVFPRA
jgi:hypothetical protein